MSNYLIDASIYALPQKSSVIPDSSKNTLYEDYLKHLNKLFTMIFHDIDLDYAKIIKKTFDINYFMFAEEDIRMLIDNELIWDIQTIKSFKNMRLNDISETAIEYLGKIMIDLIPKFQARSKNIYKAKYKPNKICTLETLTGIKKIEINDNNSYLPESSHRNIISIESNLKRNICKLAFLNKFIYTNKFITKIITRNDVIEYRIKGKINKLYHLLNIDKSINIDISNIEILNITPGIIHSQHYSITEILKNSNTLFKNININNSVIKSISQFQENISTASTKLNDKMEAYLCNYQNIIFDCITILNYLAEYDLYKINKSKHLIKENYCKSIEYDQTCKKCGGLLKICGFDCSTGAEKIIDGEPFYIHLRPYTSGDENYKDLTLRIYFRFDVKQKKIEIGHIGSHL